MALLDRFMQTMAAQPRTPAPPNGTVERVPMGMAGGGIFNMGGMSAQQQLPALAAYGQSGWLWKGTNRVAEAVASLQWTLYEETDDASDEELGAERKALSRRHPLMQLWRKPNPWMHGMKLRHALVQYKILVGEMWLLLLSPNDNPNLPPQEIWPIRPDRIWPIVDPKEFIKGYVYRSPADGSLIPLETHQVIYSHVPNPLDMYRGLGAVQAILSDIEGDRNASAYNRNFFYNSAEPGGLITFDENLSPQDFERMLLSWRQQHAGVSNAFKVAFLERAHWEPMSRTQRDMQFKDYREVNRTTILGALGIPFHMLGGSTDVNRANAEAAEVMFERWEVNTNGIDMKDFINEDLAPRFGEGLVLDYHDPVPANKDADLQEAMAAWDAGVYTLNQTLARLGAPTIDGPEGELRKPLPTTLQPVWSIGAPGQAEKMQAAQQAGTDQAIAHPPGSQPPPAPGGGGTGPDGKPLPPNPNAQPPAAAGATPPKHFHGITPGDWAQLGMAVQRAKGATQSHMTGHERAMDIAWAARLSAQRQALLAYLGKFKLATAVTASAHLVDLAAERLTGVHIAAFTQHDIEVWDGWDWYTLYGAVVRGELSDAYLTALRKANPQLVESVMRQLADGYAEDRTTALLKDGIDGGNSVPQTTRSHVIDMILAMVASGTGMPAIQAAIAADPIFGPVRAGVIAHTETQHAYGSATLRGGKEAGAREKRLVTAGDDAVCPECLANEEEGWIPIDDLFPSGDDAPDIHPLCFPAGTEVQISGARAATQRWYEGDVVVLQTALGQHLTCTPNHPILTARGWVPAERLHLGDQVIRGRLSHLHPVVGGQHDYEVPTRIEQIADALRRAPGMATAQVPVTAPDFHGDGGGSQVAVVWANLLLRDGRQAAGAEPVGQLRLRGGVELSASSPDRGGFDLAFEALMLAAPGAVGTGHLARPLRVIHAAPLGGFGRTVIADRDAALLEPDGQGLAADPGEGGEDIDALTVAVACDEIVQIERQAFQGHVYNLESEHGWYIANGIITHNCRCELLLRRGAVPPPTSTAALPGASPDREKLYTWAGYEYEPAGAPRLPAPDPAWERQWLAAVKAVEATPALQAGLVEAVTGRLQALGLTADPALARTALGGVLAGTVPTISKTDFFTDEDGTVHPIRGSDGYEDSGGGGGGKEGGDKEDGKDGKDGGGKGGTVARTPVAVPDFKTVADAETWLKDTFNMNHVLLTGIDKSHLPHIGEAVAKIAADFPKLIEGVNLRMNTANDPKIRAIAYAFRGTKTVVLTKAYYASGPKTREKLAHALDVSTKTGYLQAGATNPGAIIAHELGHTADSALQAAHSTGLQVQSPGGWASRENIARMGEVSKYAHSSPRVEGWAETFSNHYYPGPQGEHDIARELHAYITSTGVLS